MNGGCDGCVHADLGTPEYISVLHREEKISPGTNTKRNPVYSAVPAIPHHDKTHTEEAATLHPAQSQPTEATQHT